MNENKAAQPVLTDDEIRSIWVEHGLDDEAVEDFARAVESALLSKLRAPVAEVQIGVGVTEQGATVCLMQPHADGSATVIYSETHPVGDSVGRAALASAPVAGEANAALNEWFDKTDFIQKRIASGELPVKYLGWHRADVMRDLIEQPRPSDDKLWDQTLTERDEYHDMADKLADAIADHLLVEIGEHSSSNCPWMRALDAIQNAVPQTSAAGCSCPSGNGSLRHPCAVHPQASEAVRDAKAEGFQAGLDKALEVLEHDDFATRLQSAHVIRALKSQSAALAAQPGAQRTGDQ